MGFLRDPSGFCPNESNARPLSHLSPNSTGNRNFIAWRCAILAYLSERGARRVLKGFEKEPYRRLEGESHRPSGEYAGANPPFDSDVSGEKELNKKQLNKWDEWQRREYKATAAITLSVSHAIAGEIDSLWCAHDMYKLIYSLFSVGNDLQKGDISWGPNTRILRENATSQEIQAHFDAFSTLLSEGKSIGLGVADWDRREKFLLSLPRDLQSNLRTGLRCRSTQTEGVPQEGSWRSPQAEIRQAAQHIRQQKCSQGQSGSASFIDATSWGSAPTLYDNDTTNASPCFILGTWHHTMSPTFALRLSISVLPRSSTSVLLALCTNSRLTRRVTYAFLWKTVVFSSRVFAIIPNPKASPLGHDYWDYVMVYAAMVLNKTIPNRIQGKTTWRLLRASSHTYLRLRSVKAELTTPKARLTRILGQDENVTGYIVLFEHDGSVHLLADVTPASGLDTTLEPLDSLYEVHRSVRRQPYYLITYYDDITQEGESQRH
ncbi:hypothetical protein J007_06414 [Cryptococcus neoformans]|nr:hypothetical protein J007_06414 [Cryptococcus neoformans var. grubii]OXC58057.1 hypothetical protein C358_06508 [Cryptococcus neoformans var. grubii MW-RSA852]